MPATSLGSGRANASSGDRDGRADSAAGSRRAAAVGPTLSRRAALAWGGAGLAGALPWLGGCATTGGLAPAMPALDASQSYRLVNRLTWGATEGELARLQQLGPGRYVAAQLAPSGPDELPEPLPALIAGFRISREPMVEIVRAEQAESRRIAALTTPEQRQTGQQALQRGRTNMLREASARHWWRALYGRHQLREQLNWFWLNHFSVFRDKVGQAQLADYEEQAIRPHALGRFRTLLGAALRHPAMLVYLDNQANAASRPNENLARELLELHTLGVDGGYAQADVQALARVLSGHGVSYAVTPPKLRDDWQPLYRRDGAYEFNPARHDFGDKRLLGVPVPGRGAGQLEAVLDQLARHPATARFITRRLATFLLGEAPPPALQARLAEAFLRHDGDIAQTLAVLIADPVFVAARPASFKDPMRFLVSSVRAAYRPDQVVVNTGPLQAWLARLGEPLYGRLTPDGWPLEAEAWTGSGQLAARFEIARAIGSGNAGLFKPDDLGILPIAERPAFPQLARPLYYGAVEPQLAASTRQALAAAASPQDWNTLVLASPEFMQR